MKMLPQVRIRELEILIGSGALTSSEIMLYSIELDAYRNDGESFRESPSLPVEVVELVKRNYTES